MGKSNSDKEQALPYIPDSIHAETEPASVRVIPGVDLMRGTVTFVVDGELERRWHHEPRLIADALGQSVRPARWCPATQTLSLTVAARGRAAGVEKRFSFAPGT